MQIFNLKDRNKFINEVANLEYDEWAKDKNIDREERIQNKINKINSNFDNLYFCKLILIDNDSLIGFISIFPNDSEECPGLTPWYSTMYIKKEYRGKGYSRMLNDAILKEAKRRGFKKIYLKTELNNYYEKFGSIFIKKINSNEKLYMFNLD